MTTVAIESGHWYLPTGEPFYTVKAKDGSERNATLRDARKVLAYPSVTSILRCAAAPGLEAWKINTAIDAALTLPRLPGEDLDAFKARAILDGQEQAAKARERGSEIHGHLELALQGKPHGDRELVARVISECQKHLGDDWQDLAAERSFACNDNKYGGKVDLHGRNFVLDFKTTQVIKPDHRAYDDHLQQLVAYQRGLRLTDGCRMLNVFIGTQDGQVKIIEHDGMDERIRAWEMFTALLAYWQAKNKYRPA